MKPSISFTYKTSRLLDTSQAIETGRIPRHRVDGDLVEVVENITIKFGPHYYIQLFYNKRGELFVNVGATHHGFVAKAMKVDDEFENIIDLVRKVYPELSDDHGMRSES